MLCRLIYSQGSVPRRDLPLMVVFPSGPPQGTLGGGGLEQQVIQRARQMTSEDPPEIMEFQLNATDVNAEGSLCGGSAVVLLEPWPSAPALRWQSLVEQGAPEESVIVHHFQLAPEIAIRRYLWPTDEEALPARAVSLAKESLAGERSRAYRRADYILLADPLVPQPVLHIFGAGHVGQAVARLAHWLGWPTRVYDDRPELLTTTRFPHARRISMTYDHPGEWPIPAPRDLVLVATRDHRLDRVVLENLLQHPVSYVGLVSSRRKWKLIREALLAAGLGEAQVAAVHAPVGLDLGAETVPEIALSILAEMVRIRRNRSELLSERSSG